MADYAAGFAAEVDAPLALAKVFPGRTQELDLVVGPGDLGGPPLISLSVDPETIFRAPEPVSVAVAGAEVDATLTFDLDGDVIAIETADADGELSETTIDLPATTGAGSHVLTVTSLVNGSASVTLTVQKNPLPLPPSLPSDVAPVPVAGSEGRWVFQDVALGGLGSWVLPVNPREMSEPHAERNISGRRTTSAVSGQAMVGEGSFTGHPWRVAGYYPDEAYCVLLERYAALRRRFYVTDHRGRVWKVGVRALRSTPRLRQSDDVSADNDWAGDYQFDFVIFEQAEN